MIGGGGGQASLLSLLSVWKKSKFEKEGNIPTVNARNSNYLRKYSLLSK
jgi:hypothetical protein